MPVKLSFNDPMREAALLLHQAVFSIDKCEDKLFREVEVSPKQYSALAAIKHLQDPVTPTDVANWLDRNTNSITLMIDRLEREGLVTRARDLKDRRSLRISITEKGLEAFRRGSKPRRELPREIMSCLNPEELQELNRLLSKVLDKTYEVRNVKEKVQEVSITE